MICLRETLQLHLIIHNVECKMNGKHKKALTFLWDTFVGKVP